MDRDDFSKFQEMDKVLKPFIKDEKHEFEVNEMRVKLPNGSVIAGKWWGSKDIRPFICLHGWQDNAGTWDRLIPLLPREFSYFAIDLPGHGRSSWQPNGLPYNSADYAYTIYHLVKELKFPKVGIMAHSMGSVSAFLFASYFPELVDMMITTDTFKLIKRTLSEQIVDMQNSVKNFEIADKRNRENQNPPAYLVEEMIQKIYEGSMGNITLESSPYILRRNIAPSAAQPGKFQFCRDGRLRLMMLVPYPADMMLQMAREFDVPFLYLTTTSDSELYQKISYLDDLQGILRKKSNVKYLEIDTSSHYFHLNEPEKISGIVSDFIREKFNISHL